MRAACRIYLRLVTRTSRRARPLTQPRNCPCRRPGAAAVEGRAAGEPGPGDLDQRDPAVRRCHPGALLGGRYLRTRRRRVGRGRRHAAVSEGRRRPPQLAAAHLPPRRAPCSPHVPEIVTPQPRVRRVSGSQESHRPGAARPVDRRPAVVRRPPGAQVPVSGAHQSPLPCPFWHALSSKQRLPLLEFEGPAAAPLAPPRDLSDNALNGSLPAAWGSNASFPALIFANLSNNRISGSIPDAWYTNTSFPSALLMCAVGRCVGWHRCTDPPEGACLPASSPKGFFYEHSLMTTERPCARAALQPADAGQPQAVRRLPGAAAGDLPDRAPSLPT